MNLAWYVLWFVVAVSLLVTVHEFGHYWVARKLGFKVLRFSVGFGKPLLKKVAGPDRTEYVLAAIPLGGYVKMLDEREGPVPTADLERSFTRRPPWQRIAVLLAGPAFNIVFAILVLWGMLWFSGVTQVKAVVGDVVADSLAARAGLRSGDQIVALDGNPVSDQRDVVFGLLDSMSANGKTELVVRGERGDRRVATLSVGDSESRRRLTEPSLLFKELGFEFWRPAVPPVMARVLPDGPAAKAGLQSGDEVISIDGVPIRDFRDIVARVSSRPGETLEFRVRRAGSGEVTSRVLVGSNEVDNRKVGMIQVQPPMDIKYPESMLNRLELSPVQALGRATAEAWDMTVLQARLFWRMLLGNVSLKNLSGPLSIAEFAGESAEAGVAPFLGFLVLISLSLGFLNLLPIPILDGGQIVYQLIEWAKGSPMSERAQAFGQQVGIALLILLMSVALFNDIARQFS
jgi:regulator of sigma E protease